MKLFLQMGHGMKAHAIELIKKWQGGTVILSPKNMTLDQMKQIALELKKINGSILIDPQFYMPRTGIEKLQQHQYWPQDYDTNSFFTSNGISKMIDTIFNDYVSPMQADAFIIPTLFLDSIDDTWYSITESILSVIENKNFVIPKFLTLCIGSRLIENEESVHLLLEEVEDYPVDGFYIIAVHPNNNYLVDNASWLLNLLDFVAGLKLSQKKIILGYSSHQFLFMALAKVDAICSGIWLKTRVFPIGDFLDDDEGTARRSIWYYCPQALSEYQIPFLDIAQRVGLLDQLETSEEFKSDYANVLFTGVQPTTVNWGEREAFRHYLICLRKQCIDVSKDTYEDTRDYVKLLFDAAQELANLFRANGIRANHRDFSNVADVNLAVVDGFDNLRGMIMSLNWDKL